MPEVRTSIIDDVLNEKIWDGPHGRVFYSTLVLANGDRGEIGAKKQDAYSIGQELTYTFEHTERGMKLKRFNPDQQQPYSGNGDQQQHRSEPPQERQQAPRPQQQGGGGRGGSASFCAAYAKDLVVAAMPYHPEVKFSDWVDVTITTAAKLHAWMKDNDA